jgi:glycerate-2-kinase
VRAEAAGIDLAAALDHNDSGRALAALGDRIVTGPTGTNVADLYLALVE